MKIIRFVLGKIILFFDAAFTPKGMSRPAIEQAGVDSAARSLTLYQLQACPFCVKVRREMKRLSLSIPLRDVGTDPSAQAELMQGGKIDQVPCLKIPEADGRITWLYESSEINAYLQKRFG
jgi:glutaredoxin